MLDWRSANVEGAVGAGVSLAASATACAEGADVVNALRATGTADRRAGDATSCAHCRLARCWPDRHDRAAVNIFACDDVETRSRSIVGGYGRAENTASAVWSGVKYYNPPPAYENSGHSTSGVHGWRGEKKKRGKTRQELDCKKNEQKCICSPTSKK